MTVLSRGAWVRRRGRRPGWVLLTALLVLAIGASCALVFTNRVELLKLAVILSLWAAVAGAFVSVLYRRQSDADQSRVRDLKLVYELQLDREISARREYELTVESQLRRELADELRAEAADELAALRAELSALRTSLEILFDTDLQQHPALETHETDPSRTRAYSDWDRKGESNPDWVSSDRVTSVALDNPDGCMDGHVDEAAIIDVAEESLLPPRQPPPHEAAQDPGDQYHFAPDDWHVVSQQPPYLAPPPPPEPQQDWQPAATEGQWLPLGTPDSNCVGADARGEPSGGRRARRYGQEEPMDGPPVDSAQPYGEAGSRARARHSAEYRDYGVRNFATDDSPQSPTASVTAAAAPPSPSPPMSPSSDTAPSPPQMAPPPQPEPTPRHRGADPLAPGSDDSADGPPSGGQSVAELLARLQVQPSGGGRRQRRESRED